MGRMARAVPARSTDALRNVPSTVAGACTTAAVSSRHPTEKETTDTAAALTAPPAGEGIESISLWDDETDCEDANV